MEFEDDENFEEFKRIAEEITRLQNSQGLPQFEGYSPNEMGYLLSEPFSPKSPVGFNKPEAKYFKNIPVLNQVKYLIRIIEEKGELKLTKKGFLPVKVVADIYSQGFINDEYIDRGIIKLYKESDSISVSLARILLELSRIVKKRKGRLSLTKAGAKIASDDFELFKKLFITYTTNFNWSYFDGCGQNSIGQLGFGFSLILLKKFGNARREDTFYGEKYIDAFPVVLNKIEPPFIRSPEYNVIFCYSLRTFDNFLKFFGMVKIDKKGEFLEKRKYITKTPLFDKIISIRPPARPNDFTDN